MRFLILAVAGLLFTASAQASCTYNCTCQMGSMQGQYCGFCPEVLDCDWTTGCWSNVFECNPEGGCCVYGYRDSCAAAAAALEAGEVVYDACPIVNEN